MGRENVNDAAAVAEGAGSFHQRLVAVAEANPGGQEFFGAGDALADPQAGKGGGGVGAGSGTSEDGGRQGKAQGGGGGGHDQRRRPVGIRVWLDSGGGQGGKGG